MSTRDVFQLLGIVVLLVLAGGFAAAEVAITRMNRVRVLANVEEKVKGAPTLLKIVQDPARYLNVVLLLTLVCHITATTLAADFAFRQAWPFHEVIATVAM